MGGASSREFSRSSFFFCRDGLRKLTGRWFHPPRRCCCCCPWQRGGLRQSSVGGPAAAATPARAAGCTVPGGERPERARLCTSSPPSITFTLREPRLKGTRLSSCSAGGTATPAARRAVGRGCGRAKFHLRGAQMWSAARLPSPATTPGSAEGSSAGSPRG